MNKIRKGDEIIVCAGKDKGARGTVISVLDDGRIVVEGINLAKKHMKGNPNRNEQGGILDKEMPLDVSNVMIFNPKTKKGERVGFDFDDNGNKVRVFLRSGDRVDI